MDGLTSDGDNSRVASMEKNGQFLGKKPVWRDALIFDLEQNLSRLLKC